MLTTRKPNIVLIRQRDTKGMDRSPLKADSFDTNWIGPEIRNLLIPKDEANILKRKVKSGNAELISE